MLKVRLNLRKVVAIAICLAGMTMFYGCGEDNPIDPNGNGTETPDDPNKPDPNDPALTYDEGVIINGVKWATRNIDAVGIFAATSESSGMFFQWNKKTAWSATVPSEGASISGWNYWGSTDAKEWINANDPSPAGWRVPTKAELATLLDPDKVTAEWTTKNGVNGTKFTDKESKNSLFLPAVGGRDEKSGALFYNSSSYGLYWARSRPSGGSSSYAHCLKITETGRDINTIFNMSGGYSIRCIAEDYASPYIPPHGEITDDINGVVINGVRWATRNVGAHGTFMNKPEDYGALYQWGRQGDGHEQRTSTIYNNEENPVTSTFYYGSQYVSSYDDNGQIVSNHPAYGKFITVNSSYWDIWRSPRNNALWNAGTMSAPVKTGGDPSPAGWRVPTLDEIKKLCDQSKVVNEKVTINGIDGRIFTDISTGKSIFLPFAGRRLSGLLQFEGNSGNYWSNTISADGLNPNSPWSLTVSDVPAGYRDGSEHTLGYSVRPVSE